VTPPLLAGEYIMPEAQFWQLHGPTARAGNARIRSNLRLDARGQVSCTVYAVCAPDDGGSCGPSLINASCTVPADATLPWVTAHWGEAPYVPGPNRMWPPQPVVQVPADATLPLAPALETAHVPERTLTLLLVARSTTRRIANLPAVWHAVQALAHRMHIAESPVRTEVVVLRADDAQMMRDPVTVLRLFHQADVIVAVHGAALCNLMSVRPGTHVFEFTHSGQSLGMYSWFAGVGSSMGAFVTVLPSLPAPGNDVVVDESLLVRHLERVYRNHDFGPREYDASD